MANAERLRQLEDENRRLKQVVAGSDARQPGAQGTAAPKVVTPVARHETVRLARAVYDLTERRACRLVGAPRATVRYRARQHDVPPPRKRICESSPRRNRGREIARWGVACGRGLGRESQARASLVSAGWADRGAHAPEAAVARVPLLVPT